jgi:hypothetical protein
MSRIKKQAAPDRVVATVPVYQSGWFARLRRSSIWLAALALAYMVFLLRDLQRANQADFSHYYVSALAMRNGIDPYITDLKPLAASLGLDVEEINIGTYPPTFILCFEPLTWLSPLPAYWLWIAINIVFLAAACCLLLDGLPRDTDLRLALVGLAILYAPITYNFYYAQTQIVILLLLILFMRWLGSGRHALAGFMLAAATLFKVFPAILIGYLVLRRQGKAIAYVGLGLIVGGAVTLTLVGVERSLHFYKVLPFLTSPFWLSRSDNVALEAMLSRPFWFLANSDGAGVEFVRRATVVIGELAVMALTVRTTLRSSRSANSDEPVIALWIVTAILLSPTAWIHYLVLLLMPFAVLLRQRLCGGASLRSARLGLASYQIAEVLIVVLIAGNLAFEKLPNSVRFGEMVGWSLSLLLAYGAAYLLAADTMPPPAAATARASRGGPYRRRWGIAKLHRFSRAGAVEKRAPTIDACPRRGLRPGNALHWLQLRDSGGRELLHRVRRTLICNSRGLS